MALVRWDPAREIDTLQSDVNRLFDGFFGDRGATCVAGLGESRKIDAFGNLSEGEQSCDLLGWRFIEKTSQRVGTVHMQWRDFAYRTHPRGNLNDGQSDFERNRLLRCEKQPPEDRQDCVRRMSSEARTSGSVEGGGVMRELVTPERK